MPCKAKPPREAPVVRACLGLLRLLGVPAWRTNSGGMTVREPGRKARFVRFAGVTGLSDITGLLPGSGRYLAVECKRPGGKPTPNQEAFLALVRAAGGLAVVARSAEELRLALAAAGVAGAGRAAP